MTDYRIITCDLDGTLLDSESDISGENIEAIKKLEERGVYFVPCTGRSLSEVPSAIMDTPEIRYIICSNGAVIYDRKTGEKILNGLSNDIINKILDILYFYETHISYRIDDRCHVDAAYQKKEHHEYYNVCREHCIVIRKCAVFDNDFEKNLRTLCGVEVFAVFFHSEDERLECKRRIGELDGVSIVETWDSNLEIMSANAGKGNALLRLSVMLGIERERTIAIGDSDNDLSVIKAAGLGLAVSNACPSLKKIAGSIICSNDEHVAKYVLDNYII